MLKVQGVSGGYEGKKVLQDITFSVQKGEIFGILGPNGSGKTTLIKMIGGILPISSGTLLFEENPLTSLSSRARAQKIALLPQTSEFAFAYSVRETVALGRYPYQTGLFKSLSPRDEEVIQQAMEHTAVAHFADKSLQSLSGGEKQRVFLAQALAQEPQLLLLDEPTNHLDLSHQQKLFNELRKWTTATGLTIIAIFHDLNIASLYCDRLLFLDEGRMAHLGTPNDLLQESIVNELYQVENMRLPHPTKPRPQITLLPRSEHEVERSFSPDINQEQEWVQITYPFPLKTYSSAVIGGGYQWKRIFINRYVPKDYDCSDPIGEMEAYLTTRGINSVETAGMMTAVEMEDTIFVEDKADDFSLLIMVTAGVGNAVDAARAYEHHSEMISIGTINIWIFIDGNLSEEAFIQGIMTATEAKVKALSDAQVKDALTNTIATGTSTDSILIGSSQRGGNFPYAGTITQLGKAIAKGVYDGTTQALERYEQRRQKR